MTDYRAFMVATALIATCGLTAASANAASAVPAYIEAAVNNPGRPANDKARDVDRKPAETIVFAGVKPGDKVLELEPAGGYYTRILSKVVGLKGKIFEVHPGAVSAAGMAHGMGRMMGNPLGAVTKISHMPGYKNVIPVADAGSALRIPEKVDVVWTSDNYHDFHNNEFGPLDMLAFNKAVYRDLKPGGIYLIIDHATPRGKGMSETQTLHRSDPAATKKEVLAAGFVLDDQSDMLAHPNDDHTKIVFALHGKADDYVLRFKKP